MADDDTKKNIQDFLKQEYQVINSEINRAITLQISLLTATISASILLLALFMNCVNNNPQNNAVIINLDYLIFLLPIGVIIPAMLVFFEKIYHYSIKVAYAQVVESIIYEELIIRDYRGYRNIIHEFFKSPKKTQEEIMEKVIDKNGHNIFMYAILWFISVLGDIKKGIYMVYTPFKQIVLMDRNFRECRFWIFSFVAFFAIICVCYIVAFYFAIKDLVMKGISVWILCNSSNIEFVTLLFTTTIILLLLMHGYIFEKNASYFKLITLPILIIAITIGFMIPYHAHYTALELIYSAAAVGLMIYLIYVAIRHSIPWKGTEYYSRSVFPKLAIIYGIFVLMFIIKSNFYLGIGYSLFYLASFATVFTVLWAILAICSFAYGPSSIDNNYDKIKNFILEMNKEERG